MEYSRVPQNNADPNDPEGYAALREGAAVVDRSDTKAPPSHGQGPRRDAERRPDQRRAGARRPRRLRHAPQPEGPGPDRPARRQSRDEILIDTEPEGAEAAKEILGRYAPFSRVKLEELPDWKVLGLYGPRAAELLEAPTSAEHEIERGGDRRPVPLLVVGVAVPVGGYDLIGPRARPGSGPQIL